MPDQAEYSQIPSSELSSVVPSTQTESFSDQQLQNLHNKYNSLSDAQNKIIELQLKQSDKRSAEIQSQLQDIISHLITITPPIKSDQLPIIIKKVIKDAKTGFQNTVPSSPLYLEDIIGYTHTIANIHNNSTDITKKQNINTIQITDQKEQKIIQKEQKIIQKEQKIIQKEQINEEQKKNILQSYEKNQSDINKEWPTNLNKSKIIDQIPTQQLQVLREIFGYTNIIRPDGTKEENPEVWMMNDTVDSQVAKLVYYYVQLNNKIKKSKEQNSKTTITAIERQRIEEFGNALNSLGISPEELYSSIDINFEDTTNNGRFKRPTIEIENKSGESELSRTFSRESPSLANDLSNDENIDTSNLHVEGLFEDINDETLMAQFPYPPGENKTSFILPENSAKVIKMAEDINANRLKYPLIDGATKDEKKKQIAKKDALLRHILMTNPDKKIPSYILKKLYPEKKVDEKSSPAEAKKAAERNPRINRIRERISNNSRNQNREFLLQRGSLLGLMKNNFTHPSVEQSFANRIQKGYLSYVSNILQQTPGLEDIKYNPKEVIITNNKVTLPLHLRDMDKTDAIITIENGKVSISNTLYNPSDTNNINQITKGTVTVGTIKDFDAFTKESTKIIPELITQHTQIQAPQVQYTEQFQNHIGEVIKEQNDDTIGLQASIAHNISHNKVRDMTKELMHNWNNDGNQPPSETQKNSPFYQELHDYEQSEDKKITKETNPDTFDSLQLLRTTMLKNSAQDNIILKDSLSKLNTLITDKSFTSNLSNYLSSTSQHDETPKNSLLLALHAPNRTQSNPEAKQALPLLLKLFSTQYENYNNPNNTIDTKAFQQTIDQLASGTSFDVVNIDHIASTNPAVEKIYTTYNKNNEIQHIADDLNNAYE